MTIITSKSDFINRILHPIDKYGLRRLACCQIIYRIRPGDDRLLRPAKRSSCYFPPERYATSSLMEHLRIWEERLSPSRFRASFPRGCCTSKAGKSATSACSFVVPENRELPGSSSIHSEV